MEGILKFTVLAVLLSLASAWEQYNYNATALKILHHYTYSATQKLEAINTDSTATFIFDEEYSMPGSIRFVNIDEIEDFKNCGGQLGIRHPDSADAFCLSSIDAILDEAKGLKTATLELSFTGPTYLLELKLPLFKENSNVEAQEEYNSKVLRFEPMPTEVLAKIQAGARTIKIILPWLQGLLEKPVIGIPDVRIHETFVTYPVVVPEDKFNAWVKFVQG